MIGNIPRILLHLDFTIRIGMTIRHCRITSRDVIGRRAALLRFDFLRFFVVYLQFGMAKRSNIMTTPAKFTVCAGVYYARTLRVAGAVSHKDNLIAESRDRIIICHKDSSSPLSSKPRHYPLKDNTSH